MIEKISLQNVSLSNARDDTKSPYFLENISLSISRGKVLGIFGPSAAGKTTLLFLICGLLKPDYGTVEVDGEDPTRQRDGWKKIREHMAVAFQFPEDMFFHESVSEEFWKILKEKGHTKKGAASLAHKALEWAGLDASSLLNRHPLYLSQGELRKMSLALVWAQDRECIIVDEPTVGLECIWKKRIIQDIIQDCHRRGKIGIIATHDTPTLLPLVDISIILDKGKIIIQGPWSEILNKPECLSSCGLSLPPLADLAIRLKNAGMQIHRIWKDLDQATEDINEWIPCKGIDDEI